MKIGRLISPVHSLGPGERVCLWTTGCSKNCDECISPELQSFASKDIDVRCLAQVLLKVAQNNKCTGLTISGGDPFEQSDDLLFLLKLIRGGFDDILVYTGYTLDEIYNGCEGEKGIKCLEYIDVLIDGRYEKDLNDKSCVLRGSLNQVIHYLNPEKEITYTEYMKSGRIVEVFNHNDAMITTGILNRRN